MTLAEFRLAPDNRELSLFFRTLSVPSGKVTNQAWHSIPRLWHSSTTKASGSYPGIIPYFPEKVLLAGSIAERQMTSPRIRSLQKNSIEIRILQTVQNVTDIALLRLSPRLRRCRIMWPVQTIDSCQPRSPNLTLGEVRLHSKPMSGTRAITTSNTFSFHTFAAASTNVHAFCASSG